MTEPTGCTVLAYNQATDSENKIHDDTVARQHGFRGGLVPGVTVYAYLAQPAVVAWGIDWLSRGAAEVVLRKPVYDGDPARVECKGDGEHSYQGEVFDPEDTVCATGRVWLPDALPEAPTRRGDPPALDIEGRPEGTRATMERLRETGLGSLQLEWQGQPPYDRYTKRMDDMPDLIRPDRGGFAHPGVTLGLANLILTVNLNLGPWIHAQSEVQHYAPVPIGNRVHVEARITGLFERRGHEFVDLEVAAFLEGDRPALTAKHRAIYKLR
jgi:acyl dehydratase